MHFQPGETALRRGFRRGRIAALETSRVLGDDDRGLLTWTSGGSATVRRVTLDGRPTRKMPLAQKMATPSTLREGTWHGGGVLMLTPPGTAYSVWWFFTEAGTFRGWYVNLEEPGVRWRDGDAAGVDIADHALDIWVTPDRSWRWKDEDEFEERTDHPAYWDATAALEIRAEGERVITVIEKGAFPFDGSWVDFSPDPGCPPTRLPPGWDRPRATA